jgi:hypothetical protein
MENLGATEQAQTCGTHMEHAHACTRTRTHAHAYVPLCKLHPSSRAGQVVGQLVNHLRQPLVYVVQDVRGDALQHVEPTHQLRKLRVVKHTVDLQVTRGVGPGSGGVYSVTSCGVGACMRKAGHHDSRQEGIRGSGTSSPDLPWWSGTSPSRLTAVGSRKTSTQGTPVGAHSHKGHVSHDCHALRSQNDPSACRGHVMRECTQTTHTQCRKH